MADTEVGVSYDKINCKSIKQRSTGGAKVENEDCVKEGGLDVWG